MPPGVSVCKKAVARERVGWPRLRLTHSRIRLHHPGVARCLTAQGPTTSVAAGSVFRCSLPRKREAPNPSGAERRTLGGARGGRRPPPPCIKHAARGARPRHEWRARCILLLLLCTHTRSLTRRESVEYHIISD